MQLVGYFIGTYLSTVSRDNLQHNNVWVVLHQKHDSWVDEYTDMAKSVLLPSALGRTTEKINVTKLIIVSFIWDGMKIFKQWFKIKVQFNLWYAFRIQHGHTCVFLPRMYIINRVDNSWQASMVLVDAVIRPVAGPLPCNHWHQHCRQQWTRHGDMQSRPWA